MSTSAQSEGRLAQHAAEFVLGATVVVAVMEVLRVALDTQGPRLAIAVAATALYLPLHLWHLHYGLRGERPPRSGATLAAIAVIQVVALFTVGLSWVFMLSCLATSALIVLRPRWAALAVAACALGPVAVDLVRPDLGDGVFAPVWYSVLTVTFRSFVFFAVLWLVAAIRELEGARAALAADAREQERARLRSALRSSLDRSLGELARACRSAREAMGSPGVSPSLVALDRVVELSREALVELRQIVAETRAEGGHEAAAGLARTARVSRTPVGRGLTTRGAWGIAIVLHLAAYASCLGVWLGTAGADDIPPLPAVVAVTLGLAALQMPMAADLARGRAVRFAWPRVIAANAIAIGASVGHEAFLPSAWFAIAATAAVLSPRWMAAWIGAWLAYILAYALAVNPYDLAGWTLAWNTFYEFTVITFVPIALAATPALVRTVEGIESARDELAHDAVNAERRRVSGDLHDVLGQGLTAISLKGDLARKLIERDPDAAARELTDLSRLVEGQIGEVESVARGEREIAFAAESSDAVDLLRSAGIGVRVAIDLEGLDGDTSTLLGHAVREGATNVLRHAKARRCVLRAGREGGQAWLEMRNDGAPAASRRGGGTGIATLAERAESQDGSAEASEHDGWFTLRVRVPERELVAA